MTGVGSARFGYATACFFLASGLAQADSKDLNAFCAQQFGDGWKGQTERSSGNPICARVGAFSIEYRRLTSKDLCTEGRPRVLDDGAGYRCDTDTASTDQEPADNILRPQSQTKTTQVLKPQRKSAETTESLDPANEATGTERVVVPTVTDTVVRPDGETLENVGTVTTAQVPGAVNNDAIVLDPSFAEIAPLVIPDLDLQSLPGSDANSGPEGLRSLASVSDEALAAAVTAGVIPIQTFRVEPTADGFYEILEETADCARSDYLDYVPEFTRAVDAMARQYFDADVSVSGDWVPGVVSPALNDAGFGASVTFMLERFAALPSADQTEQWRAFWAQRPDPFDLADASMIDFCEGLSVPGANSQPVFGPEAKAALERFLTEAKAETVPTPGSYFLAAGQVAAMASVCSDVQRFRSVTHNWASFCTSADALAIERVLAAAPDIPEGLQAIVGAPLIDPLIPLDGLQFEEAEGAGEEARF